MTRLEKILSLDRRNAVRLFIAEAAAVLLHDAAAFFWKKDEPVTFLVAAFVIPGYLLTALFARAFAAARSRR